MVRTWVRAIGAALLAAAILGAGQLGMAYGLGVLRWQQHFIDGRENGWTAHLTWASFIAALAVIGGAWVGAATLQRHAVRGGLGNWIAVALAAGLGAAVTLPLMVRPAELAVVNAALNPPLQVGIITTVGSLVGVLAAPAVLAARPLAASALVTAVWTWAFAVLSAYRQLAAGSDMPSRVRLGMLDLPALAAHGDGIGILAMIAVPVLAAASIAGYARWLGERTVAIAASGVAGPALLAIAYLLAGRGVVTTRTDQLAPYVAALGAAGAGLVTSMLIALIRRGTPAKHGEVPLIDRAAEPARTGVATPVPGAPPFPEAHPLQEGPRPLQESIRPLQEGSRPRGAARPMHGVATPEEAAATPQAVTPPEARASRDTPEAGSDAKKPRGARRRGSTTPQVPFLAEDEEYAAWLAKLGDSADDDVALASGSGRRRLRRSSGPPEQAEPGGHTEHASTYPEQRRHSRGGGSDDQPLLTPLRRSGRSGLFD